MAFSGYAELHQITLGRLSWRPLSYQAKFISGQACDVACWHETVMPVLSLQVRYEGMNGLSSVAV
jgi:hypothetical protein